MVKSTATVDNETYMVCFFPIQTSRKAILVEIDPNNQSFQTPMLL